MPGETDREKQIREGKEMVDRGTGGMLRETVDRIAEHQKEKEKILREIDPDPTPKP